MDGKPFGTRHLAWLWFMTPIIEILGQRSSRHARLTTLQQCGDQMKVTRDSATITYHVPLRSANLLLLHQILNNAVNGLHVGDYQAEFGCSYQSLKAWLETFGDLLEQSKLQDLNFDLEVSVNEGDSMIRTLQFVLDELGEEEFSLLTGFSFQQGEALLAKFAVILDRQGMQRQAAI